MISLIIFLINITYNILHIIFYYNLHKFYFPTDIFQFICGSILE